MTETFGLKIFSLFLVTLVITGGVESFYHYVDNYLSTYKTIIFSATNEATKRKKMPSQNTGKVLKKNYDIIMARELFKGPENKPNEQFIAVETEVEPSISSMEVSLIGTITGKNGGSRAILLDKKKKTQEVFYLGDSFENAIVKEISRGKVVLDVNGKKEVLLMEENKSKQSSVNKIIESRGVLSPK